MLCWSPSSSESDFYFYWRKNLTRATVVVCFLAISFRTGSLSRTGRASLFGYGRSGDPKGE